MGRDREGWVLPQVENVSIHTPAWGVTKHHFLDISILAGFNPHARMGRDHQLAK